MLFQPSQAVAGHLATAIRMHREWAARLGLGLPPELAQIEDVMTEAARSRQQPTALDDLFGLRDRSVVTSLAVTYADVAEALSISVRSVERLVAAGELGAVRIGGSSRVRIADLNRYVDSLAQEDSSA